MFKRVLNNIFNRLLIVVCGCLFPAFFARAFVMAWQGTMTNLYTDGFSDGYIYHEVESMRDLEEKLIIH